MQDLLAGVDLDHLSAELRGKSKDLLSANLMQTKRFFRKLKRYIDFLSTPSVTVSECRMKQQIAAKITRLLASEESRLEGGSETSRPESSVSCAQSESQSYGQQLREHQATASNISTNSSNNTSPGQWKLTKTRSEEKYERRGRKKLKNVEIVDDLNKKRIEHIHNLKRELKILERLEKQISLKEDSSTNSSASSMLPASPTRKLTFVRNSVHGNDTTTVTDILAASKDTTDTGRPGEDKGIQVGRMESDLSSTLSLISEQNHRLTLHSCKENLTIDFQF